VLDAGKWSQPGGLGSPVTITYSFSNFLDGGMGGGLTAEEIRDAVEEALSVWAEVAPLNFVEQADSGPSPVASDSGYAAANHPHLRFGHHFIDGPSVVLAYAYFPPPTNSGGEAGDLHYDNTETWALDPDQGLDIIYVSVHEIGHALGLQHQPTASGPAIMNPFYDAAYNGPGTAFLRADDVAGIRAKYGTGVGSVTPLDDPGPGNDPTISITDVSVTEGDAGTLNAVFTVSLSEVSDEQITVNYSTQAGSAIAGTDYNSVSSTTLIFDAGVRTRQISVQVRGDTLDEFSETFTVNLATPTNATIFDDQGVCTISDNDAPPGISIADVQVLENNAGSVNMVFTVSLSAASGKTVTTGVTSTSTGGSATAGSDYVPLPITPITQLTFNPGTTTRTVTIRANGDSTPEADETFFVDLVGVINATATDSRATGTILDNDTLPSIRINHLTTNEGDAGTLNAVFTVWLSRPSNNTITVQAATSDGTARDGVGAGETADYNPLPASVVTFLPGERTQTVTVQVRGDLLDEQAEYFNLNLSAATNAVIAQNSARCTILDNDAPPTISITDVSLTEGNSGTKNFTFNVNLSTASGNRVTVQAVSANGTASSTSDYFTLPRTLLTFAPGTTQRQVTVRVRGDSVSESTESFFVNLSAATNAILGDAQGRGDIQNDDGSITALRSAPLAAGPAAGQGSTAQGSSGSTGGSQAVLFFPPPRGLVAAGGTTLEPLAAAFLSPAAANRTADEEGPSFSWAGVRG
jgi:hypothetical protein